MKTLTLLLTLLTSIAAFAGDNDHPLSTIQGTHIDMKVADHAFAGAIKDFVAFGNMDEEHFTSTISMKQKGKLVTADFAKPKTGGILTGSINGTVVTLVKLDKATATYSLKIADKDVDVTVKADDFKDGHFINPTYSGLLNGEKISFTLIGKACYGYSAHLISTIFGILAQAN